MPEPAPGAPRMPEQRDHPGIIQEQIDSIVAGDCNDPFAVLGPHALPDGRIVVRVFVPDLAALTLVGPRGGTLAECSLIHPAGLWTGTLRRPARYRLRTETSAGPI